MGMPPGLASMVNTLRSDVDTAHDEVRHQLFEAARLRVADDRTAFDILDRLKSTISTRFLRWFEDGQFAKTLEELGQQPKQEKRAAIAFPTSPKT